MKCIILAGGFARRLQPVVRDKAKALLEIGGKPIIGHIIEKIPDDIEIIVATNVKFEHQFVAWQMSLDRRIELHIEEACCENEKPGAVNALHYLVREKRFSEDLLVIAGDNYFEFDLSDFIRAYNGINPLIAVHDLGDTLKARHYGVVSLEGKRVIDLVEKPLLPSGSLVSTACYLLPPAALAALRDFCANGRKDNLGSFISYLVTKYDVQAYVFRERWFDIGTYDSYIEASQILTRPVIKS